MSVQITYFVHGTTIDNEKGIATGHNPGELSELGIKQSRELGGLVKDKHFDAVFCSDLKRAVESAQLAFGNKYKFIPDKRLREVSYGYYTGHKVASFKKDPKKYIDLAFTNGESYKDVEMRIKKFIDYLKKNYNNKQVAIVAHQGTQFALDVLLRGKTWEQAIDQDWRKVGQWQPGWEYKI